MFTHILKRAITQIALALLVLIGSFSKIYAQIDEVVPYGDLIMTPVMGYTINKSLSNIPTHFLVANGVKANFGFELGLLAPVATTAQDARAFFAIGVSQHFLGFTYNEPLINLAEQKISNHRHARAFIGVKFIPFDVVRFFTISANAGYGRITANYASKNINGRIKAAATDISISFSFGVGKFVFR